MKTSVAWTKRYRVAWTNVRSPGLVYYSAQSYRWRWGARLAAWVFSMASILHPRECRHYFILPLSQIKSRRDQ